MLKILFDSSKIVGLGEFACLFPREFWTYLSGLVFVFAFSVASNATGLLVVRWLVTPDALMSVFVHIVSTPLNIRTSHVPLLFNPRQFLYVRWK